MELGKDRKVQEGDTDSKSIALAKCGCAEQWSPVGLENSLFTRREIYTDC